MLSIANESDLNINYGITVVKFWATWCMPCKMYTPIINTLDEELEDIEFLSIDVDQVSVLAQKYKIRSLPTLLILKDGQEIDRILGVSLIAPLRKKLNDISNCVAEKPTEECSLPDAEAVSS